MTGDTWVWTLLGAWCVAFGMSFGHGYIFAPAGDPMMQTAASLGVWILWQLAAMALAIAAFVVRQVRKEELSTLPRLLGPVPLIVNALLWLSIAGWIGYQSYQEFA